MSCLFTARCWRFFVARLWLFATLTGAMGWANAEETLAEVPLAEVPATTTATATTTAEAEDEKAVQAAPDIPADALVAPTLGLKPPTQGALTLPSQLTAPPVLSKRKIKGARLPQVDLQFPQEYGLASWYGAKHHNKRTASGERFDMHDFTAAHPTLPFGSRVCVRSALTGREVVVRINDRGGFAGKRVIDISHAAAEALGMAHLGTKPVTVHTLPDDNSGCPGTDAEEEPEADDTAED